ncbi:hypothetical protein WR25_22834 [Diploscapter pachys]|uniref:Small ribosomal subunit protein eS6 n=1 Tax=Diploscapter pachys TaxID=2018661 RepID=A0A2A2LGH4_9BILA|nr:hypothetical protein WR25_22834 [Diploscapter pachys]
MKLNFAYPATGQQKMFDFEDEKKLRFLYDKRMAQEVEIDSLGDEWKGYVVRIGGGNDKQGFPMKQGVLTNGRVRLLLKKGDSCYRPRKAGERKRKSVRGCIVDANLSALNLVIVKKGDGEIEGLTDQVQPRKLGPKRASKIRKLFNLTKEDDVRKYVITHKKVKEGKRDKIIAPKIQRLITPTVIARRKALLRKKRQQRVKAREDAAAFHKLMQKYAKEEHDQKIARRRSSASHSSETDKDKAPASKGKKPAQAPAPAKGKQPAGAPAKGAQKGADGKKGGAPAPQQAKKPASGSKKETTGSSSKSAAAPAQPKQGGGGAKKTGKK